MKKNYRYSAPLMLALLLIAGPAALNAQVQPQPTTASGFSIQNMAGESVTLRIPASGVSSYSLFFPSSTPSTGSLFVGSNNAGQLSWLTPGTNGQVLQMTGGTPVWSNVNLLPNGSTTNATLVWNGTNWVENPNLVSNPTTGGGTTITGPLTVTGGGVNLPSGTIDNVELANSSFNVSYGAGVTGDASVALGGTLNISNSGVTGINAGTGISVSGSTGSVTINNTGILAVNGTTNQVNASTTAGTVTLTLPQDIHTGATPTFSNLILNGISNTTSGSNQVLVRNTTTNQVEARTIFTLPGGTAANTTLRWNGTNWVENTALTSDGSGNTTVGGNFTVATGGDVVLPNGVINNNELQNSSVTINTGAGLSGGGSVALGGSITLTNNGVTGLTAGPGITVSGATGAVTIGNSGILSVTGTANQVTAATTAGAVTLSLPQNIHTDATPTFDNLFLDNITNTSSLSNQVLVRNTTTNAIEARTIFTLPGGTAPNSTLRWNGTNWVENTNLTSDASGNTSIAGTLTSGATTVNGNLTVSGGTVTLPNGQINNNELENSSVTINAGTGLSGGGTVALGGSVTLTNNGVTGLTAGPGITLSGSTGAVTVSNGGILSVTGTTNQVNAVTTAGAVSLTLPQNIHTGASPTFSGLTLNGLPSGSTATNVVVSNGGTLETRSLSSLTGAGGRVATTGATNSGAGWQLTIPSTAVGASNAILVTYEDPAGGPDKTMHVINRTAGTSFVVRFSGAPAAGSFVNYQILP